MTEPKRWTPVVFQFWAATAAESGEFIELYAQQFMSGSRSYPAAGVLMHTKMKALCRELVADELIYECGRGRR